MREIRFRVVDEESGQVFNGDEIEERYLDISVTLSYGQLVAHYVSSSGDYEGLKLIEYTGLKDKNGVEIYEGDIYHMGDPKITYTVIWQDTGLKGKQNSSTSYAGLLSWQERIEVIGNIYENPELLDNKK